MALAGVETQIRGRKSRGKGPFSAGHAALKSSKSPLPRRTSHHFCNGYRPQADRQQPLRTYQLSGSPQTHPQEDLLSETSLLSAAMTVFWGSVHPAERTTSSRQQFPPSGEEGTSNHPRPSTQCAPRPRASPHRHGNRPPPHLTPPCGKPLPCRQQVPQAQPRGLQL